MANDYCTLAQVKEVLVDSGLAASTDYDAVITSTITRACRAIDRFTGRDAGAYAVTSTDETTRYYAGSGYSEMWVDEMAAAPSYVGNSQSGGVDSTSYTTLDSTGYFLWPLNETPYQRLDIDTINGTQIMFYRYPKSVKVTAAFGYALAGATPGEIEQAAIIQAVRWFKRGQQAFKDVGAIPELGQLAYAQALDPDVKFILDHYRRLPI